MRHPIAVALLIAGMLQAGASTVASASCSEKPVKATGGLAILEGAARSKARSAWIRKVTEKKSLGASYAVWLRAKNPTYACRRSGQQHVCDATAIPCKI